MKSSFLDLFWTRFLIFSLPSWPCFYLLFLQIARCVSIFCLFSVAVSLSIKITSAGGADGPAEWLLLAYTEDLDSQQIMRAYWAMGAPCHGCLPIVIRAHSSFSYYSYLSALIITCVSSELWVESKMALDLIDQYAGLDIKPAPFALLAPNSGFPPRYWKPDGPIYMFSKYYFH